MKSSGSPNISASPEAGTGPAYDVSCYNKYNIRLHYIILYYIMYYIIP